MKVTILGCGPSGGVPLVGGNWGVCDPANPKNRRRRPSILIEADGFNLLVDTSPDLRDQLLDAGTGRVDAVLYTHEHADHVMGIDDLRGVWRTTRRMIDVYAAADVLDSLTQRFAYIFAGDRDTEMEMYRPICRGHVIDGALTLGPFAEILPLEQDHGICPSLGFRFGDFAYSTDVVRMPEDTLDALAGIDTWVVDCLRDGATHPTHANLEEVLRWVDRVRPRRTILTHMNHDADYETLRKSLPDGMEPAWDGMSFEITGRREPAPQIYS